ncbi:4-hydroxy-tetrahydrodipicolinate reductase [Bacteroidales bacterium OttesenSCG-928-K03]|nr:4-hydroxy-tetrahydrodipicolinate reductase [Odoribacter sp. OttesenSCG-928-L07]MDL2242644.1 4-hydroxy-tetrahydrodipicolinate reductase [Bacteroidales bacterium OttesenSCG-928-K03]
MNCCILGYGKMGKTIERLLLQTGNNVIAVIDNEQDRINKIKEIKQCDIAFEFSMPETAYNNIIFCFENNIPIICGTTGWTEKLEEIKKLCTNSNQSMIYASNFSIGMNIFMQVNKYLSNIMAKFDLYDVSISETHHIHKKDKPSGTALSLKNIIAEQMHLTDVNIESFREGEIIGEHTIRYRSNVDNITLTHEAINRDAFAAGAILAAKWLIGKKGYFEMTDVINS